MWAVKLMNWDVDSSDWVRVEEISTEQLAAVVTLKRGTEWPMVAYAERRLLAGETSMALCEIAAENGHHDWAVDQHLSDLGVTRRLTRDEAELIVFRAAVAGWRAEEATAYDVASALSHYDRETPSPYSGSRIAFARLLTLRDRLCSCCSDRREDDEWRLGEELKRFEGELTRFADQGV